MCPNNHWIYPSVAIRREPSGSHLNLISDDREIDILLSSPRRNDLVIRSPFHTGKNVLYSDHLTSVLEQASSITKAQVYSLFCHFLKKAETIHKIPPPFKKISLDVSSIQVEQSAYFLFSCCSPLILLHTQVKE